MLLNGLLDLKRGLTISFILVLIMAVTAYAILLPFIKTIQEVPLQE